MEHPLISICIPAYKDKHLKEAIESAINQTYSNIEIIIVNDKSPYDLDSIVSSCNDSRISYYTNAVNLGSINLVNSWNECLKHIKGNYFCFLCDDDVYKNNHIVSFIPYIEKYPNVGIFKSRSVIIDNESDINDMYPSSPEYETYLEYLWHILKVYRKQTLSELLFKTEVFNESGKFVSLPLAWGSDQLTAIKCACYAGIVTTNSATVEFRLSGENISSQRHKNEDIKFKSLLMFHDWIDALLKDAEDSDIKRLCIDANTKRRKTVIIQSIASMSLRNIFHFLRNAKSYSIRRRLVLTGIAVHFPLAIAESLKKKL